jgi:hypothetical protein
MKKKLLEVAMPLFMIASLLISCSDNDNHESQQVRVLQNNGVFVVSSGYSESFAKGCITYYDYTTKAPSTLDSLMTVAGSFDENRNCDAVVYGSKLYVVVSSENMVYVRDVKSGQLLVSLSTIALMGEGSGLGPRRVTAALGNIYVSTQSGYIAAIDTANYQLAKTYKAGSMPEGITIAGTKLYVTNSDGGRQRSPSISVIDLNTGSSSTIIHENIRYPQDIAVIGDAIYYLDLGTMDQENSWQLDNGVYCIQGDSVVKVVDATGMAVGNVTDKNGTSVCIYTYNKPLGVGYADYWTYNVKTRGTTYFTSVEDADPSAIGVDPITGDVFIAFSWMKKIGWATYVPDYTRNGFVSTFGTDGVVKDNFDCGIRPAGFAFYVGVKYVDV